jgi:hypothetical protein
MTKEETIEILNALWRSKDCGYSDRDIREALDFAIMTIKKEPCKGNKKEYYTTRLETIKMLTILKKQAKENILFSDTLICDVNLYSFNFAIDSAIKLLKQEPKTGHWVVSEAFGFGNICECSECNKSVWIYKDADPWNYCPKCGIKMEEK